MKILFLLSVLTFGSLTFANKEVGNGGDVVVCRNQDKSINSIELMDYYEARELRQMQIQIDVSPSQIPTNDTVFTAVKNTLERIKTLNPSRYEKYLNYASSFFSESLFVTGKVLTDIPDSDHLFLPIGCNIEQIAIQKTPVYPHDPRYIINKDLWTALPMRDAVGLVLHEIIYREMILAGFNNSTPARYFNSVVAANSFQNFELRDYILVLAGIPLPDFDYKGLTLALCLPGDTDGMYSPCNEVKVPGFYKEAVTDGIVVPQFAPWIEGRVQYLVWKENKIPVAGFVNFYAEQKDFYVNGILFYSDFELNTEIGNIIFGRMDGDDENCEKYWTCLFWDYSKPTQGMSFYPSGKIRTVEITRISNASNNLLSKCGPGILSLYESGRLRGCTLADPVQLKTSFYTFLAAGRVVFSQTGSVIYADEMPEGSIFLPNQEQVVVGVTKFQQFDNSDIKFSTRRGLDADFFGNGIEFGPGEFYFQMPEKTLKRFKLKVPVELANPKTYFIDPVQVVAADLDYDDQNFLTNIEISKKAYLRNSTGGAWYPANSRIYFNPDGTVRNCEMIDSEGQNVGICYLN